VQAFGGHARVSGSVLMNPMLGASGRLAPKATELLRGNEMTRRAISGLMQRSKSVRYSKFLLRSAGTVQIFLSRYLLGS
jgi:hypothetical protein